MYIFDDQVTPVAFGAELDANFASVGGWVPATAGGTLDHSTLLCADSTAGPLDFTLPLVLGSEAVPGWTVAVGDGAGTSPTNNITISANADDYMLGVLGGSFTLRAGHGIVRFVVNAAVTGWYILVG
jgi:hypothetical protein